jgi:hypothetical protein
MPIDTAALADEIRLCVEEFNRLADLASKVGLAVGVDVFSIGDRNSLWSKISVDFETRRANG